MSPAALGALFAALSLVVGVLSGVGGLAAARVRVQTAADAAALAAVGASPLVGGDGAACEAARRAAAGNGATLQRCDAPAGGWALQVAIEVVGVPSAGPARLLPSLRATAAAALEPAMAAPEPPALDPAAPVRDPRARPPP